MTDEDFIDDRHHEDERRSGTEGASVTSAQDPDGDESASTQIVGISELIARFDALTAMAETFALTSDRLHRHLMSLPAPSRDLIYRSASELVRLLADHSATE